MHLRNTFQKSMIRSHLVQNGGWDELPDVIGCGRSWSHPPLFTKSCQQNYGHCRHITAHFAWNVGKQNRFSSNSFGLITQYWYWNRVNGMRDDFLCKSKRRKQSLHASASESFHEKVHLKYIVGFKFWQAMENLNNFLVIQLWHFHFILRVVEKRKSLKAFMGGQVIG